MKITIYFNSPFLVGSLVHECYKLRKTIRLLARYRFDNNAAPNLKFFSYLNVLNLKLQKQGQLVNGLYNHLKAFQNKIRLWDAHIPSGNSYYFTTLSVYENIAYVQYAEELEFSLRSRHLARHTPAESGTDDSEIAFFITNTRPRFSAPALYSNPRVGVGHGCLR
ncbi:hypothetical protein EVAR_60993_1 [Eumeta japonica]|uniref:Uncharacterized protein n=1 Tax=Eumeta variegata TaxID=151549 RepID=A0A4C1ZSG7_EUMVA|nr:hypothetical protein EVAR_60993_1 [Eumeta japonica]